MIRRPVQSSNISSIGWEPGNDEEGTPAALEVEFRHGGVYRYVDVPEHEYRALLGASSPGKHLRQHIIGVYDEERA